MKKLKKLVKELQYEPDTPGLLDDVVDRVRQEQDPEVRHEMVKRLLKTAKKLGATDQVGRAMDLLDLAADAAPEADDRAEVAFRRGQLLERLGSEVLARMSYADARAWQPEGHEEAAERLEELEAVYSAWAERARELFERGRGGDEKDRRKMARKLAKLGRQLAEAGKSAEGLGVLDRAAELATTAAERAEISFRRGRVLEEVLWDEAGAMIAYQETLIQAPEHEDVLAKMRQAQLTHQQGDALVARYLEAAGEAAEPVVRGTLLRSAAEVCHKLRPQSPEAAQHLRESLEADPDDREARRHLERLAPDGQP